MDLKLHLGQLILVKVYHVSSSRLHKFKKQIFTAQIKVALDTEKIWKSFGGRPGVIDTQ